MWWRVRRFLDLRAGEALPVALAFLYIAVVVAAYLLAKPIRNGLFLKQYGPYALVYVYAGVPLALTLFVPVYARVASRFGQRVVAAGTLVFFAFNVLGFWLAFRWYPSHVLPGIFYVWVNCFGVIAPVQAWSFANSLFDTRQAKRLFGIVGSGASLGAILGGLLARVLVAPVGGPVNLLLVLAALIFLAAVLVSIAAWGIRRHPSAIAAASEPPAPRRGRPVARAFSNTLREIAASPYLRLIATTVFLVAIVTQWTGFQLSVVADRRFSGDAEALTRFFGTFNFSLGIVSFIVQLALTGTLLRRFGLALGIMMLPVALSLGTVAILLVPGFWPVLFTNAFDQGLRFSVDKASYELLYLPIASALRVQVKSAIDIVVSRVADASGGILLGLATAGFAGAPGLHLGLRGTAAINTVLIAAWVGVAIQLRREYVRTIRDSIHQHRIDSERAARSTLDRSAADALIDKLQSSDPRDVLYALSLVDAQGSDRWRASLRDLLHHPDADVRRRALARLGAEGDRAVAPVASDLLHDPDLGVRTEALLYLSREMGIDPLARIQELGDFEGFSIRAGTAAFLASPGPSRNLEAARIILEQMIHAEGPDGVRERIEAARLLALVPEGFEDLVAALIADSDPEVARHAIGTARVLAPNALVEPLVAALGRDDLADPAAEALSRYGNPIVPLLQARLLDERVPLHVRREIPIVLVRIGSAEAGQALIDGLLQADATLRFRVIASLNKLRRVHPDVTIDRSLIELLLAAEISGHYRSYQVLGALRESFASDDGVMQALRQSMDQELERIFRLMALAFAGMDLHDAYVGLRSSNQTVRANALEFLDNVLAPPLRQLLVPLLDPQIPLDERIALADRVVGAPLTDVEQAIETLLGSQDKWLQASAARASGALRIHAAAPRMRQLTRSPHPSVQSAAASALRALESDPETSERPDAPAHVQMGV